MKPIKVCIVGLGAIGGLFAGWLGSRLAPGRIELSALTRGATLAALRQQRGLLLHDSDAAPLMVPIEASDDPAVLGPQDLVIVAVKSPALASVAPAVAALSGPQTTVLAALNGVPWWFFDGLPGRSDGLKLSSSDPGGTVHALVPTAQVVGCVVHAASMVPAPGAVRPVNGRSLIIGRPAGGNDAALGRLAELFDAAGFETTVSERIQRDVWFKLWGNMTINPVSALTGATGDRILADPLVCAFCSAVMLEAQAIGRAFGIDIDQTPEERLAFTRKLGAFKTSMLQDKEAGRPLELDALLGTVHEIGAHLGLPTPQTDALLGLTRLMARTHKLYPDVN